MERNPAGRNGSKLSQDGNPLNRREKKSLRRAIRNYPKSKYSSLELLFNVSGFKIESKEDTYLVTIV